MHLFKLNSENVIVARMMTDDDQGPDYIEVEAEEFFAAVVGHTKFIDGKVVPYEPPVEPVTPVYSGTDALDAMSEDMLRKGRWKDALRVALADDVRTVKSKLKRIADANGVTVADLVPGIPVT